MPRYSRREIGDGRACRQPGQVRKEAAVTISGSGRCPVSHPQFQKIHTNQGLSRQPRKIVGLSLDSFGQSP
uniref:- partial genomic shotgun *** SEQUENCING IN PROGRESS *** n=1 Tax=Magnetospirillum gryphiswaldense TaxID=55518 RepID=Q6N0C1_9PROT|nr:unnamed protein product [Magnetospirillum gryphiswaldense]